MCIRDRNGEIVRPPEPASLDGFSMARISGSESYMPFNASYSTFIALTTASGWANFTFTTTPPAPPNIGLRCANLPSALSGASVGTQSYLYFATSGTQFQPFHQPTNIRPVSLLRARGVTSSMVLYVINCLSSRPDLYQSAKMPSAILVSGAIEPYMAFPSVPFIHDFGNDPT